MYYQVLAFTHHHCEQELREQLAFNSDEEKREFLNELVSFDFIHEAYLVSTCNRVEVVTATRDSFSSYHTVLGVLSQKSRVDFYQLKESVRCYDDEEAILHIFSVVSSLDSLVIGESQITGQVKDAFRFSYENKTAGRKLNRVISYAIKCAAEVRNVTNISKNPISIASVAVAQAHKIYGDNIRGMTGVVVGTGEMGILAAKHLLRLGCDVVLLGRDKAKAEAIANELGENARGESIDKLPKYINRYRLLFSATSASDTVIKSSMIEDENIDRVWFDMAIPRDIDDIQIDKIQLFRIDDLRTISNDNYALKQEQALQAMEIVKRYEQEFYQWLRALSIEPVIKSMRIQAKEAIERELERAIGKRFVPEEYRDNMKKMAEQMFNRFLHDPTQRLRKSSAEKSGLNKVEAIKEIFNISTENIDFKQYKEEHHKKGYEE